MSFTVELNLGVNNLWKNTNTAARRIQLELFRGIVLDTPVREGTLRGNWQLGINSYPEDTLDSTEIPLSRIEQSLRSFKLGDSSMFVNNLPYAYPIEFYGTSGKAPDGMLRKNVIRLNSIAAAVMREVRRGTR